MIEQVLDDLVNQFSDPFTFYRELIQNAMDAGTGRVDVEVEWRDGMAVVDVVDQGEGMTRPIIDKELTRLFSSSKESDLTKIGKFGIGFVSVFALDPERVVVDTGRAGEYWRVVFDGTTEFDCLRLEMPVEGTRVRLYKRLPEEEFPAFLERSRRTVSYWCRFSDTPVHFCGEALNEPLDLPGRCRVRREGPGTEVVAALSPESPPLLGMYNRGLTLMESREEVFPGVAVRVRSRYLEHTLTRDNVIRDHNYAKAMAVVTQAVRRDVPDRLFALLGEILAGHPARAADLEALVEEAWPFLAAWRRTVPRRHQGLPLLPALHGPPLSLRDLRRAGFLEGSTYADPEPSPASEELFRHGVPVVAAAADSAVGRLLGLITGRSVRSAEGEVAALRVLPDEEQPEGLHLLETRILRLARRGRGWLPGFSRVRAAQFDYPGSPVRNRPCLARARPGEPVRLFDRGLLRRLRLGLGELLLNPRHPLVARALGRASAHPALSAYVLAKVALLQDGVPPGVEARLMARCLEDRP